MLIVWDLLPPSSPSHSPSPSPDLGLSPPRSARAQPTAYPIPFAAPLSSLRAHPATGTQFLAADAAGGVFLVDWRADPAAADADSLRHSSVVELVSPSALAAATLGSAPCAGASVDWRADAIDMYACLFFMYATTNMHTASVACSARSLRCGTLPSCAAAPRCSQGAPSPTARRYSGAHSLSRPNAC